MKYILICLATAAVLSSILVNIVLYLRYRDLEADNNRAKTELGSAYYAALYNDAGVERAHQLLVESIEVTDVCIERLKRCQRIK